MPDDRPIIHLVNPMFNAAGGSEQRVLGLFRELSPFAEVKIWATEPPDARFAPDPPIRLIDRENYPVGGTVVILGVWFGVGDWIRAANPKRIVLLYNTNQPYDFAVTYRRLNQLGFFNVEVVAASQLLLDSIEGMEGIVQQSPIDISRFRPNTERGGRPFTVGRLSRDTPEKHHPSDPELYRRLADAGCRIRIMGGTCLADLIPPDPAIDLLPAMAEPADEFLRSLDCFYYRTHDVWLEAMGRVITEAMATGLPVVAHRRGGYCEIIDHGVNGFLFETEREAERLLLELMNNPGLRRSISEAARRTMEETYEEAARAKLRDFYLGKS